jgi:hypothetical protein
MEGDDGDMAFKQKRTKKSFKNVKKNRGFQWRFLVACLIVEGYFVYNFTNSRISLNNM